jgi:hypothetical protein
MPPIVPIALAWLALAPPAASHAPVFVTDGMVELGDATKDSWALCGSLKPGQKVQYRFSVEDATRDKFWMGLYAPACSSTADCPEYDFDYRVAIYGMPRNSSCARWPEWGEQVAASGAIAPSEVRPSADYIEPGAEALVLEAPAAPLYSGVYEPFTPTSFAPRGACVSDFPPGTLGVNPQYVIVIWSEDEDHVESRNYCVGLGRAEMSVFAPLNVLVSGYTTLQMHQWNRWSTFELTWPWILDGVALVSFARIARYANEEYPLTMPQSTDAWALLISALFISSAVIVNFIVWFWALTVSGTADGWYVALALRIFLPLYIARGIRIGAYLPPTRGNGWWLVAYGALALTTGIGLIGAPLVVITIGLAYTQTDEQQPGVEKHAREQAPIITGAENSVHVATNGPLRTLPKSHHAVAVRSHHGDYDAKMPSGGDARAP